jgi:hypothetical protein
MNAKGYFIVYDILRDGIGVAPVAVCLGILIVFGVVAIGMVVTARKERKERKPIVGIVVWLVLWGIASLLGGGNVLYQHFRCVAWARSGDFQVLEGRVTQFHPNVRGVKGNERFTVNGFTFSYSDSALGQGGFRYPFGPDGQLHEGVQVRVSHRDGRILKLEIQND